MDTSMSDPVSSGCLPSPFQRGYSIVVTKLNCMVYDYVLDFKAKMREVPVSMERRELRTHKRSVMERGDDLYRAYNEPAEKSSWI